MLVWLVVFAFAPTVHAAFLYLDPESVTVPPGEQFTVKLMIDTEGEAPTTTDALLRFNSSQIKLADVQEAQSGERFFPKFFKKISVNKVYIGGAIEPNGTGHAGTGVIAVLTFEGLTTGQNIITFSCEPGKTADSNISLKRDRRVVDIVDCSKLNQGVYTISSDADGSPTPTRPIGRASITPMLTDTIDTPTPSLYPSLSPTISLILSPTVTGKVSPTPARLPESGIIGSTAKTVIMVGVALTIISIGIRVIFKL